MLDSRILHSSCITACLSVFAYRVIQDIAIDVRLLDSDSISDNIQSDKFCNVVVDHFHRGIFLRNETFSTEILQAKLKTIFSKMFLIQFLNEQADFLHILEEGFLTMRFVAYFGFMAVCIALIEVLVVRRMGNLVRSYRALKQLESEERKEWFNCIKEFSQEKMAVLLFCIARNQAPPINKHYIDFGEYVRDTISLRARFTDITLFACFYCMVAIGHVATNSIFVRFMKTVPLLERNLKTRLRGESVFVVMYLTLNALVALSAILIGATIVSYAFVHSDYATIFVLESARLFIRTMYVLDRLTQCVCASRMEMIESRQNRLTDEQISVILVTGFQSGVTRKTFRNIYIYSTLFMSLILYSFFAKNGLFVNRKLLAMRFVTEVVITIDRIMNTEKIRPTELL
ncbi:unnamed protein product [Caenorhabditis nigoni]